MSASRARMIIAVAAAIALGVATYLLSTAGMRALRSDEAGAAGSAAKLPEFAYAPPETVPTTADYGPVGPVSLVFAGSKVVTGLTTKMENPWIAVSSQTGDYRALSAPHRPDPRPDAVSVSPDGLRLAWGYDDGIVLYDPVADDAREVRGVGKSPLVGDFSPDGSHLALYDGALRVLDVDSGQVVATIAGVDDRAARQAVWTPDGRALTFVVDGRLITHEWESRAQRTAPAPISGDATLAWSPSGSQLAAMEQRRGVKSVEIFDVAKDGGLSHNRTVAPDRYAQQRLLGFISDTRVTVTALTLQTGTLPLVFQMSTVDTAQPAQVMQLTGGGVDWNTLQVAAEPLASGSASYDEPDWPVSDRAKLVASILVAFFVLGLYLTRRPGRRRLWSRPARG